MRSRRARSSTQRLGNINSLSLIHRNSRIWEFFHPLLEKSYLTAPSRPPGPPTRWDCSFVQHTFCKPSFAHTRMNDFSRFWEWSSWYLPLHPQAAPAARAPAPASGRSLSTGAPYTRRSKFTTGPDARWRRHCTSIHTRRPPSCCPPGAVCGPSFFVLPVAVTSHDLQAARPSPHKPIFPATPTSRPAHRQPAAPLSSPLATVHRLYTSGAHQRRVWSSTTSTLDAPILIDPVRR